MGLEDTFTNGKLDFGLWEQLFYREIDGRPRKRVLIKINVEYLNPNIFLSVN